MMASSSAITTRVGRAGSAVTGLPGSASGQFSGDAVEEGVLFPHELGHRSAQRLGVAGLRVGVTARVTRLDVGEGRFGHERPEPPVFGLLLEESQLLLG